MKNAIIYTRYVWPPLADHACDSREPDDDRAQGAPDDARTYALHPMTAGEALCREADPLTAELEALMLAPLSDAERKAFVGMVDAVKIWLQGEFGREVTVRSGEPPETRTRSRKRGVG